MQKFHCYYFLLVWIHYKLRPFIYWCVHQIFQLNCGLKNGGASIATKFVSLKTGRLKFVDEKKTSNLFRSTLANKEKLRIQDQAIQLPELLLFVRKKIDGLHFGNPLCGKTITQNCSKIKIVVVEKSIVWFTSFCNFISIIILIDGN